MKRAVPQSNMLTSILLILAFISFSRETTQQIAPQEIEFDEDNLSSIYFDIFNEAFSTCKLKQYKINDGDQEGILWKDFSSLNDMKDIMNNERDSQFFFNFKASECSFIEEKGLFFNIEFKSQVYRK
ncbi:MAG: hypothetical protein MHPSP_001268 [Paramarteilia canceri]